MTNEEKAQKIAALRAALDEAESMPTHEDIRAGLELVAKQRATPPPSPEETARAAAIAALTAPRPAPGRRPTEAELMQAAVAAGLASVGAGGGK